MSSLHFGIQLTTTKFLIVLVSIPSCLLAEQNSPRSAEQRDKSAGQDQETADHWGCACVAKISAATIYFAVGIDSFVFDILTRFQDCCLCDVASRFGTATTSETLDRDTADFIIHGPLDAPGEDKPSS